MGKQHLKYEDRVKIEHMLKEKNSINGIARALNFSPSSISREIEKNSTLIKPTQYQNPKCARINDCPVHSGARSKPCSIFCEAYTPAICPNLSKQAINGLCNACSYVSKCKYVRKVYRARQAQNTLEERRSKAYPEHRIPDVYFDEINEIVSDAIKRGISLYSVYHKYQDKMPVSESTIRNWICKGYLDACYLDTRRPQFKSHKKKKNGSKYSSKKDKSILDGRTFEDFKEYYPKSKTELVQVDTVIGRIQDDKSILTIHWPKYHFQIGILLEHHTSECVIKAFSELRYRLGLDLYARVFQTILTDNGSEFDRLEDVEVDYETGEYISKVFYCDAYSSFQKGACERNHEYIRYISPKGQSLDGLNQEKVDLMFSHINSMERKSLHYQTPYFLFKRQFGEKIMAQLHISFIAVNEIIMRPSLIK